MENHTCYGPEGETGLFGDASFWTLWLSAIPMVTLFMVTVTANGSIILMFISRSNLRKCRNTYIMSLAVADFLIGLTLPVTIVETLSEEWALGDTFCTVFLTIRYSLYYIAILSIILITADRWWSVNFPFSYRVRRSKKMSFFMASIVWLVSFVIHIPSIGAWNLLHVPTAKHHRYCRVPYEYNPGFTISASVIQFFIPLVLLISLNTGLYIKLVRRRNNKKLRRSLSTTESHSVYRRKSSSDSDNTNNSDEIADLIATLPFKADSRKCSSIVSHYRRLSGDKNNFTKVSALPRLSNSRRFSAEYLTILTAFQRRYSAIRKSSKTSLSSKVKSHDDVVRDYLVRQDNKAVLSLGLLVIMFVLCWTPSTFCAIFYSVCPSKIPTWVVQLSYWILALNSALNPFLYGIGSSDFRRVAKSWFMLKDNRSNLRVLETLLYNQLIQPCDMIALREVDIIQNEKTSCKDEMDFV